MVKGWFLPVLDILGTLDLEDVTGIIAEGYAIEHEWERHANVEVEYVKSQSTTSEAHRKVQNFGCAKDKIET